MLTRRMRDVLEFVDASQKATGGVTPSMQEISDGIGAAGRGNIVRLVNGLEKRGYIRRLHHRARAIEILRRPGDPPRREVPRCIAVPVMGRIS